jgi:hypothetical protein
VYFGTIPHPAKNAAQKKAQLSKVPFVPHLRCKKEMLIKKECNVTRGQNEKILSMPTRTHALLGERCAVIYT